MTYMQCRMSALHGRCQVVASDMPDGKGWLNRTSGSSEPVSIRGGYFDPVIPHGGFNLTDLELPAGVPVNYNLDLWPVDRVVQKNMLLTPSFAYGSTGWTPGMGRTLTTPVDTDDRKVCHITSYTEGVEHGDDGRTLATGKTSTLLPGTYYIVTGRVRFSSSTVLNWADVRETYTWDSLKASGLTWNELLSQTVDASEPFGSMFVHLYDTLTGTDVTTPVNVISFTINKLGVWYDFSSWVKTPAAVTATTEVRLAHGTEDREYGAEWDIDKLAVMSLGDAGQGVSEDGYHGLYFLVDIVEDPDHYGLYLPETVPLEENPPGSGLYNVPPGTLDVSLSNSGRLGALHWFDGDTAVPDNPAWSLMGEIGWTDQSFDSTISWAGAKGNSVSIFLGPSHVRRTETVQLNAPVLTECEPVILSDPVALRLNQWFGLLAIDPLSYPSRQAVMAIINRAPSVAVSGVRSWAVGKLSLLTTTLEARALVVDMFAPGRILLYRNPNPLYPETDWYLAIGDTEEARILPDARRPERMWTVPFVRVERPAGLIDAQSPMTWRQLKDTGLTWRDLRKSTWIDVFMGDLSASGITSAPGESVYTPTIPVNGAWS